MSVSPRPSVARWILCAGQVVAFACVLASAKDTQRSKPSDAPTPEWREGPIRYIITRSEDDVYRKLESEEERQKFIDEFWQRRDPTPETPGNEYRSLFWRRVREASSLYGRDTPRPGWLTDRGKVHILFGAPDEVQRDEMAEGRRGIIVWIYKNSPSVGGGPGLSGPNQVIAFAQDGTGEYRMTAEPTKVANIWEGLPNPQPPMGQFKFQEARRQALQQAYASYLGLTDPVIQAAGGPARETPLATTMLLSRLQQPPREWNLNSEVTTREFFGVLPFRARADFFKTSGEQAQVTLTVAVKSQSVTYRTTPFGDEPSVEVFGRILDSTATQPAIEGGGDLSFTAAASNRTAGVDEDLLFQSRAVLPAGTYIARLTVTDAVSGKSGTSDTPFTVPDLGAAGLVLSSVTLASLLEPADPRDVPLRPAFVIGKMRVVPRLGQTYTKADTLSIYYQVYGAERDPASGQPSLDVAYVFSAGDGDTVSEIGRVTFQGQHSDAHGYSVPLAEWPPGEYLLRIEVNDTLGSRQAKRDVLFRIVEGS